MPPAATLQRHRDRAERTATESCWPARLARAGLVTRGLMHVLVGWLALRIAAGDQAQRADQKGALAALVRQPLGRLLVLALALGFLGYASWRLIEAILDPEGKGTLKRAGNAARGVLYLGFFVTALSFVLRGESEAGGSKPQDLTARVLGWPLGRPLVVAVGLAIIGTGLWNGWRAVSRKFEKDLKKYEMSPTECRWTTRLGVVGHLARLAAYLLCGGFLVRAAVRWEPGTGVGLDAALHELAAKPHGPWSLALVGIGLGAFGLYQFALARYRQVLDS